MKPRPRPIPGFVYVLESLKHIGVCKIGRSTRGGVIRAAELDKIRGYRGFAPWRSAAEFHTTDCVVLEMAVHKRLKRRRVRLDYVTCRELFRISPSEAISLIHELNRKITRSRQSSPIQHGLLSAAVFAIVLTLLAWTGS